MIIPVHLANGPLKTRIRIPGSKSMANRALLLAALADGVSEITDIPINEDTVTFIEGLRALGIMAQLDKESSSCIVGGGSGEFPRQKTTIFCKDAGTVARFLTAACASADGIYHFDAGEQLKQKDMSIFLRALILQGAKIMPESATHVPYTITGSGGLEGGQIEIAASDAGQFVSALLMAAPYAKKQLLITTEDRVNQSRIEMTCEMMADFGVLVKRMHSGRYIVPTPQCYRARDYTIEPDLSFAIYFFAAAAVLGGEVSIQAVGRKDSKQADIAFLTILEKMGCCVIEHAKHLTVQGPCDLEGVSVDMRRHGDTLMALAAIAPFAKTPTTITNLGQVRKKTFDRIRLLQHELRKCKIEVEEGPDWLKIYPSQPQPAVIDCHQDEKIVMAFSVIGLRVEGMQIENMDCIYQAWPNFFKLWEKLF